MLQSNKETFKHTMQLSGSDLRRRRLAALASTGAVTTSSRNENHEGFPSEEQEQRVDSLKPLVPKGILERSYRYILVIFGGCFLAGFIAALSNNNEAMDHWEKTRKMPMAAKWSLAVTSFQSNLAVRVETELLRSTEVVSRPSEPLKMVLNPDYGDLEIVSLRFRDRSFERQITAEADNLLEQERDEFLDEIDADVEDKWYSYEEADYPTECVRPRWAYTNHAACNSVHELSLDRSDQDNLQEYDISYIDHGYTRDAFRFTPTNDEGRKFVMKSLRYRRRFDYRFMSEIQHEAFVMDLLTSSDHIINIYGRCATTIMVETGKEFTYEMVPANYDFLLEGEQGRIEQEVLDEMQEDDVRPLNNFTAEEKLDYAITIAESVAFMHGNELGPMTIDDVHPDQYLVTEDGRLVLNDVSNGVILHWNEESQTYCKYSQYFGGGGDFHAPEELVDDGMVDESVDVFAVGSMIFSLLTGLYPYYDETDEDAIGEMAIAGVPPYIDPRYKERSFIETRLVAIMESCHEFEPSDRVDIFEVVQYLKETKAMYHEMKEQRKLKVE
jgi:serine/threonine protein kinase